MNYPFTEAKPLHIAVVGCGAIGTRHALAVAQSPVAHLVAVCDIDNDRAEMLAQRTGARAFRSLDVALHESSFDAVMVATPDHLHTKPTLTALQAGCHVFCEKPLAVTRAEAEHLIATAADCERHLAVDYNRRFGFAYVQAKELLTRGVIGAVRQAAIRVSDGVPASRRGGEYALLTMLLTHHIDLARWLCGEIRSVFSRFGPLDQGSRRDVSLLLTTAGDAQITLSGLWRTGQTRTIEEMHIEGENGSLHIEDVLRQVTWRSCDPDEIHAKRHSPFAAQGNAFYDTVDAHIQEFLSCLKRGEAPPVTASDGARSLAIVEAAIQSHETEKTVTL